MQGIILHRTIWRSRPRPLISCPIHPDQSIPKGNFGYPWEGTLAVVPKILPQWPISLDGLGLGFCSKIGCRIKMNIGF